MRKLFASVASLAFVGLVASKNLNDDHENQPAPMPRGDFMDENSSQDMIASLIERMNKTDKVFRPAPYADVPVDQTQTIDEIAQLIQRSEEAQTISLNLQRPVFLQFRQKAEPLTAFTDMCSRLPENCAGQWENFKAVIMDNQTYADFLKINIDINAAIEYRPDDDKYNARDYWNLPQFKNGEGMQGDCEDYVLAKMVELEKIGVPKSSMAIVVVKVFDENQDYVGHHAVLAVRTDRGDLLFDNRRNDLLTPTEVVGEYEFVSAQSLLNKGEWHNLGQPKTKPPKPHI